MRWGTTGGFEQGKTKSDFSFRRISSSELLSGGLSALGEKECLAVRNHPKHLGYLSPGANGDKHCGDSPKCFCVSKHPRNGEVGGTTLVEK